MHNRRNYLFSSIIGQDKLKTAYLANIINPDIGGLLITGPKGTGKSTLVHSISNLLPDLEINQDCPFNCLHHEEDNYCDQCKSENRLPVQKKMKVVNLPISVTEDRLIGTINIEKLLTTQKKEIQVGILGEANNNILYIDEVNLLPDHIVDDILDVAASKINTIEREGVSITHASKFVLVGTMNPEEGDLRPQILDRFPLCVKAESIYDPTLRVEIIKRNILFENNYKAYEKLFKDTEEAISLLIKEAKKNLDQMEITDNMLRGIASGCAELKVDGQRPDIIITKTALTLACMDKRNNVIDKDIILAAQMSLNHRTRDGGLLDPPSLDEIREVFSKHLKQSAQSKEDVSLKMSTMGEGVNTTTGNFVSESSFSSKVLEKETRNQIKEEKKK